MEQRSNAGRKRESDGGFRPSPRDKAKAKAEETTAKELCAPAKVRLLASEIQVVFVPNLTQDNHSAFGIYDDKTSTVQLLEDCSKSATQDTIVHELLHAVLQAYELDSEKVVRALTPGILSMVRDNHDLVAYLQS